jgi:hypothetical protein
MRKSETDAIMTKAVEPFVAQANVLVKSMMCNECERKTDECFPCNASLIYYEQSLSLLIAMSAVSN